MPRRLAEKYWRSTLSATARAVQDARLTYLSAAKLHVLECCLARIEADGVAGDCVEFGVALGGSGIVIARATLPTGAVPEAADFPDAPYLEFGWGDAEYYPAPRPTLGMALRAALETGEAGLAKIPPMSKIESSASYFYNTVSFKDV